ncbi:multiple inositol polyphosphate phosphatase 1 [Penaeus vannamei]|uniref:multiple inositol polyphosphate phosphatase 1 n=1 Tax=Penaeus vannamei TaxID=6689 RepID=UPI00387F6534
MSLHTVVITAVIAAIASCSSSAQICDGLGEVIPVQRLSTKTGYFSAVKDESYWPQFKQEVWGCAAKQIWLLNRHGTRYPTGNDMGQLYDVLPGMSQRIVQNHNQGRGCLAKESLDQLSDWFPSYGIREKEQLHEMGYEEQFALGEYWRDMFPHLNNVSYDPQKFKIEFTVKNRTGQSAYHFLRGMFGDDAIGTIELPEPYSPNFILRAYKSCPRWLKEVYKNEETTYKERRLFTQGEIFQSTLHAVSSRLGFMHPLTPKELEAIYDECRYEMAWWPKQESAWCMPFTSYDFEVMEYHQDLKYYYEDSYGTPLNSETACRTYNDLYSHFRTTISQEEAKPQGIFYFAHDKTILKVLARIGLFRPSEHLRHDNFAEMRNRVWRSSFVSPFSANIVFVLYQCGMQFKVGTFFEGQPTPLPELCTGVACHWKELQPWLHENYQTCDLSQICMMHDEL